jgi:uracil-DNA glycosylase
MGPVNNISCLMVSIQNISGIGNYILSEGLYRAKVDPFASLGELSQQHLLSLFRELRAVCRESFQSQRSRKSSDFKFELQCYGRKTCIQGKPVFREIDGPHGRTIWYVNDQLFMPRAQRKAYMTSSDDEKTDMNQIEIPMSSMEKSQNNVNMDIIENHSITRFLIDESWKTILGPYLNTTEFRKIDDFVQYEQRAQTIYPPSDEIFAALNKCPFDKVKVIIIGQDPYHGQGQGHGLAFSVRKGIKIPPSLHNIFKELVSDQNISLPKHGNLDSWANQGVLLLNTVLTVRAGMANSHAGHGWEMFTDEIVRLLNMQKDGLVFLLWGNQAALKASSVDTQRHTVIITSHPSPLGSMKTNSPFTVSANVLQRTLI